MARARDKFISGRVKTQTRENKIECLVAAGLAIAGVGIIAECYTCDHLVSKMVAFDLMRNRVAISERVRLTRANDFDALSMDTRDCEHEQRQTNREFHPLDSRTNLFSRKHHSPSTLDCAAKQSGDGAFPTVDVNLERTEHAKQFAMQAKRCGA